MNINQNGYFARKVAFVTGAASGIGRAAALAFSREGASVVAADVSDEDNQETARLIEEQGRRALAVRCDVTRPEDVKAALAKTVEAFGRLDFAFNNSGIEPKKPAPTADYDEDEWNRIIDINLRGVFLCMKHEIPLILKHGGGGAIVNTSSGEGIIGIILGGLLFGVGFALLSYCPGTGAAALGQGNFDALAGILGLMAGSYLYAESSALLGRTVLKWGDRGKLMLPELVRVSPATFVLVFASLLVVALVVLDRVTIR